MLTRANVANADAVLVPGASGGPYWSSLVDLFERGGRYICAGPLAELREAQRPSSRRNTQEMLWSHRSVILVPQARCGAFCGPKVG